MTHILPDFLLLLYVVAEVVGATLLSALAIGHVVRADRARTKDSDDREDEARTIWAR
jgi:hypothetical protein